MRRYILIYGLLAGFITIAIMVTGMVLSHGEVAPTSAAIGFLVMFLAFSLIYFGIRKYRDREQGGVITFNKAFLMGLAMTGVAGIIYVIIWEIYLGATDHAFIHQYSAAYIENKQAAGISGEALAKVRSDMAKMIEQYGNPLYRIPMTFTEILPVGLIVSLVSAFLLKFPRKSSEA